MGASSSTGESPHKPWQDRTVDKKRVAPGVQLLNRAGLFNCYTYKSFQICVAVLTFISYTSYHMSRKPFSVVANVLAPNCSNHTDSSSTNDSLTEEDYDFGVNPWDYTDGWPPFNGRDCKTVIGYVDYAWLFTYAVFMIGSGFIADRVHLRYFLTIGMFGCGVFVGLLGVAYYAEVHKLVYFIMIQIFVGIFQSTGWPGVVAVMGNWFGKKNRGLFLGIWTAHTSVGNILGTTVPSIWATPGQPWAWSFFVPAIVMFVVGLLLFFFLPVDPAHVGLPPPKHHLSQSNSDTQENETVTKYGTINSKNVQQDPNKEKKKAISIFRAIRVPGVIEFALALFFAKLVAYTFLFWLPYYIRFHKISGHFVKDQKADIMAICFDVGGIIGAIITGLMSDLLNARATSSVIMMYLAVPTLFVYRSFGHYSVAVSLVLIIFCGLFINGPYALITTAVSNDLGTHKSLKENQRAKATVGAIIDGCGSLGAATGPLLTGWVSDNYGWDNAFYVLMASCFLSSLMLSRLLFNEVRRLYRICRSKRYGEYDPLNT